MIAGDGEEHPPLLPPAERGLDELEARPVVGEIAGDHDRVRTGLFDRRRRPKETHVRVARRRVEEMP